MLDGNPDENQTPEKYRCETYTVTQLALKWGVAVSLVYDLHHAGKLTIVKIGAKSVIFEDDLQEFRKNNVMPRGRDKARGVGKRRPKVIAAKPSPASPAPRITRQIRMSYSKS